MWLIAAEPAMDRLTCITRPGSKREASASRLRDRLMVCERDVVKAG